MTELIIISALGANNRVIGRDGKLPWPLIPEDAQRFQALTLGHPVIMGRKTWEFDLDQCPLANRCNIVITRQPQQYQGLERCKDYAYGLSFVTTLEDAIATVQDRDKAFIVGGAGVYAEALAIADTWELTLVEGDYEGDTFFPDYFSLVETQFRLVNLEAHPGFRYETYRKIS
ncbi:MAG: dihydrofolate reductase [Oculatellaceae cyanobacterium Prado106]|nr:dihydrofolate reductase [Oculatellaceae cyanobacterium Prado106]